MAEIKLPVSLNEDYYDGPLLSLLDADGKGVAQFDADYDGAKIDAQRVVDALNALHGEVATLRARAEAADAQVAEWQAVGSRIQDAATGKPGPLSDGDVIAELTAMRHRLAVAEAKVAHGERHLRMAKATLHEWQVANRNRVWVARAQRAEAKLARVRALVEGLEHDSPQFFAGSPLSPAGKKLAVTIGQGAAEAILAAIDGEGGA